MHLDKYTGQHFDGGVTLETAKARHCGAVTGKCHCGSKRDPSEIKRVGSRTWIACLRCLAQIEQLT